MTDARARTGRGSTGIDFPVVPSFLGTAVSGGCGCFAFLAGAVLAIALFAPRFLSDYGARVLERDLDGIFVGARVEVEDMELAWRGSQTAGLVTVHSPEGELLLQGSLTLPSIFALFGNGGARGDFVVRIDRLVARVDEEGGSDLARALGLDVEAGETVLSALRGRALDFARGGEVAPDRRRERRLDVRVAEGLFVAVDGRDVMIEDLDFSARSNRLGAVVHLSSFRVRAGDADGGFEDASAGAELHAALDAGGRFTYASAEIDPMPADVLRTIGWLSRVPRPTFGSPRSRSLHARAAEGAIGVLASLVEPGAAIELRFGAVPAEGADRDAVPPTDAEAGDRPVTLQVSGEAGRIDLTAVVRGDGADAVLLSGEGLAGAALRMEGPFPSDVFAALLRPLAPAGVGVEPDAPRLGGADGTFTAASRRLEIPLGALADGWSAQAVERLLRGGRVELQVTSRGTAARIARRDASAEDGALFDDPEELLRAEHRLTRFNLRPDGEATVLSQWSTGAAQGALSSAVLRVPAGIASAGPATLDLEVYGMPRSLLVAASDLPDEIAALFHERLHRVVIRGLPVATIANRGALVPSQGLGVEIFPTAEFPGQSLDGTLRNGSFRCERARFDLSLEGDAVRRTFLESMMPWIGATRSLQGQPGRIVIDLEGLEVDLSRPGGDRKARVSLRCDPLEVQLHRGLTRALGMDVDADELWITWAPPRVEYLVNADSIDYVEMDVPVDDEESARMSGDGDLAGSYTLRGEIEWRLLTRTGDGGRDDEFVRRLLRLRDDVDLDAIGVDFIPVTIDARSRSNVELLFNPRVFELLLNPLGVDDGGR